MKQPEKNPRYIILLPLGFPWDWLCDYEIQTARRLAKNHTVIAFTAKEGISIFTFIRHPIPLIRRMQKNLYLVTTLSVIPYQRFETVRSVNRYLSAFGILAVAMLIRLVGKRQLLWWLFPSQPFFNPVVFKGGFLIYDVVDFNTTYYPRDLKSVERIEDAILRKSRAVFTNSQTLFELKKGSNPHTYTVPLGFDDHLFLTSSLTVPSGLKGIPRPRVLYVGNINLRIDFNFVRKLARSLPRVSFVFMGPIDRNFWPDRKEELDDALSRLTREKNVYFLPGKPKRAVPSYIKHSDIGFIPFDVRQDFARFSYPMKTMEYFYFGKPVIATPVLELSRLTPYVTAAGTHREAKAAIERILHTGWPAEHRRREKRIALENSWDKKISAIESRLERLLPGR